MKTRQAQILAALGSAIAVSSIRWAWVLAIHHPPPRDHLTWTALVVGGLAALVAMAWSMWLFYAYPRGREQAEASGPKRLSLYQVDRAYSVLCCTLGAIAAFLFISQSPHPVAWILTGPPLIFAHVIAGMAGWRPTFGPPLVALFISIAFVLYYHLLAAPGYVLRSRTEIESRASRTPLRAAQLGFVAVHVMLVVLMAWLMQA